MTASSRGPFRNSTRIEGSARFSPDGSRIAFASLRSGASEVWVAERDGSGLQQVTTLGAVGVLIGGWSAGRHDDRVRSSSRRQYRRLSRRSRWRAPAPADRRTLHGRRSVVVARRAVDLFRIDTRRESMPDIWRIAPNGGEAIATDAQRRLRAAGIIRTAGTSSISTVLRQARRSADARLMRVPLVGGHAEPVLERVRPFLWSVTDTGIAFVTREPDFDAIDRVPVQRSAGRPAWAGWDFGYRESTRT